MKRIMFGVLFSLMLAVGLSAQSLPEAPTPNHPEAARMYDQTPAHDPFWDTHRPSDKHFWLINTEAYASDLAPLLGGIRCRRKGPEGCTENYGAFYLGWGLGSALELAAGTGVYHMCRKDNHNNKKCDIIQHLVTGINLGWGIHEAFTNGRR
jgi:hypothetical protein